MEVDSALIYYGNVNKYATSVFALVSSTCIPVVISFSVTFNAALESDGRDGVGFEVVGVINALSSDVSFVFSISASYGPDDGTVAAVISERTIASTNVGSAEESVIVPVPVIINGNNSDANVTSANAPPAPPAGAGGVDAGAAAVAAAAAGGGGAVAARGASDTILGALGATNDIAERNKCVDDGDPSNASFEGSIVLPFCNVVNMDFIFV